MTERSSAASATVVASGPCSVKPNQSPAAINAGTNPNPGLIPNRPQQAEGMRIDPRPSFPTANGTMPAATAAALPPEEPPGVRSGFHGLRVIPQAPSVVAHSPISGNRVLPTTI